FERAEVGAQEAFDVGGARAFDTRHRVRVTPAGAVELTLLVLQAGEPSEVEPLVEVVALGRERGDGVLVVGARAAHVSREVVELAELADRERLGPVVAQSPKDLSRLLVVRARLDVAPKLGEQQPEAGQVAAAQPRRLAARQLRVRRRRSLERALVTPCLT